MKRLLYIGALALLLLADRGTDIGVLRPVELISLKEQGGIVLLETDTGDCGWGLTVEEAVAKLKETTPGRIYLDTADYLLLEEGTERYVPVLCRYLKKSTAVTFASDDIDLVEAAAYLRIHKPSGTIGRCTQPVEKVVLEGGKMNLKIFQEK